jgi:hypothetical protein
VPAASEAATAVETPEAGGVGETYTTVEAARYAMAETATPEMGDTYPVETHAVMDDRPRRLCRDGGRHLRSARTLGLGRRC